jgi:guanosine-3',5'-bis(diphosphate) 3'-pyrophosphohydrolase
VYRKGVTVTRSEFFARLKPFHAPSTLLDIEIAYTLAKFGHRAQVRKELDAKGKPLRYFEHPKRVALILIDEVRIVRADMVIGCLLHDGLEDTRDITPEILEHLYGDVVTVVKTLSKVPKDGYLERFYVSTDFRPYVIKGCDRLDNLRSLAQATPDFQARQIAETREKYYPLFDRMVALTPPEYLEKVRFLRDTVIKTAEAHRIPA